MLYQGEQHVDGGTPAAHERYPDARQRGRGQRGHGEVVHPDDADVVRDSDVPLTESIQKSERDQVVVCQHGRRPTGDDEVTRRDAAGDVRLEGSEVDQLGVGTLPGDDP